MRRAGSALLLVVVLQAAFATAALAEKKDPISSLVSKVEDKVAQHDYSSSSYDSDGEKVKDNIKSWLYNKDKKGKASPSPSPSPKSPSPSPKPVIKDAYAFTPNTDAYPIPSGKGDYKVSDFTSSPAPGTPGGPGGKPKVPIVYDYAVGEAPKTLYHPFSPKVVAPYGSTAFPPMQCQGNAYCFKQCFDKKIQSPYCPKGWSYDDFKDICTKSAGYQCEPWVVSGSTKPVNPPPTCLICPNNYVWNNATLMCELPCPTGYTLVTVNGTKYCVQDCPAGYFAYGNLCVSAKCYNPAGCGDAACLPGFSFYWINPPTSQVPGGGSGKYGGKDSLPAAGSYVISGAYDGQYGSVKDIFAKDKQSLVDKLLKRQQSVQGDGDCQCCYTVSRDSYKQKCEPPKQIKPKEVKNTCPRVCPVGCTLDLDGLCHCPCPDGCDAGEKCCYPCPAGMVECNHHGRRFCAPKKAGLCGLKLDSCKLMSVLYEGLDNSYVCPSAAAIQAIQGVPVVWVNGTAATPRVAAPVPVVVVNTTKG